MFRTTSHNNDRISPSRSSSSSSDSDSFSRAQSPERERYNRNKRASDSHHRRSDSSGRHHHSLNRQRPPSTHDHHHQHHHHDSSTHATRNHNRHHKTRHTAHDDTSSRRVEHAVNAAIDAAAVEAFRLLREPGGWLGAKGVRVATAALGAAALDSVIVRDPGKHSKQTLAKSTIGGLLINRLANGSRKRQR